MQTASGITTVPACWHGTSLRGCDRTAIPHGRVSVLHATQCSDEGVHAASSTDTVHNKGARRVLSHGRMPLPDLRTDPD